MLLPSILVRRLDFKGASCQKYGVVQILKVEQDSRQVEKDLSIVWGDGEGPFCPSGSFQRGPLCPSRIQQP